MQLYDQIKNFIEISFSQDWTVCCELNYAFSFPKTLKKSFFISLLLISWIKIVKLFIPLSMHSHIYTESLRCRLSKIYLNSSSSKVRI